MATIPDQEPYIQPLKSAWYNNLVSGIDMLRLDVIHPVVSGNKWYKLKHNVSHLKNDGYSTILTFGGAYSNHLIATAATAYQYGIKSIGVVKGTYAQHDLTDTLKDCLNYGMHLEFVSNEEYRRYGTADYIEYLSREFDNPFIVPIGGANEWGRDGSAEISEYIDGSYTHICVSVGTGTTLIGIRNGISSGQMVLGYVPMKGGVYMKEEIDKYLDVGMRDGYMLYDAWHCGGFGKWNTSLVDFMNEFYTINNIPLDMVYTAKMMLGLSEQLNAGIFHEKSKVLCIHTGGLQGNTSLKGKLIY